MGRIYRTIEGTITVCMVLLKTAGWAIAGAVAVFATMLVVDAAQELPERKAAAAGESGVRGTIVITGLTPNGKTCYGEFRPSGGGETDDYLDIRLPKGAACTKGRSFPDSRYLAKPGDISVIQHDTAYAPGSTAETGKLWQAILGLPLIAILPGGAVFVGVPIALAKRYGRRRGLSRRGR